MIVLPFNLKSSITSLTIRSELLSKAEVASSINKISGFLYSQYYLSSNFK
ncbi:hypothetical protein [Flavobacterium psychrophilum]|nr:hypothetical protein [Flavobacterium psychrophilum]